MCELFGVTSAGETKINDYVKEFFGHSSQHPHGWGLAQFTDGEVFIEKEPIQASKSHYLKHRLSADICVKNAFAHIRYATIGNIKYTNCHPYTGKDAGGRRWTLVHNGTIFDYPQLHEYVHLQQGDTDSERVFLYLLEKINKKTEELKRPLTGEERFALLNEIVSDMSKGNKLNLLIFDGELMYVHTNYRDSLHYMEQDKTVYFSTQPLSKGKWKPLPFMRLLAYQNGVLKYQGNEHGNEYLDNAENTKFLYQIFSSL